MDEEKARQAVKDLLDLANGRMAELTSPPLPEHEARQFAAGGFARCVMLLEGMHAVTAPDARPEIVGVLMRSFAEAWLVTDYVLLGGQSAVHALATGTYQRAKSLYKKLGGKRSRAGLQVIEGYRLLSLRSRTLTKSGEAPRVLDLSTLTNRVARMRNRRSPKSGLAARMLYRLAYSAESYKATHTNLATLNAHVIGGEAWRVLAKPSLGLPPLDVLIMAAGLTVDLAVNLFVTFDRSPQPFIEADAVLWAAKGDADASA